MEGGNYIAVDVVLPSAASFMARSLGFLERCDLTRMNVLYTGSVNKVLFEHKDSAWVEGEQVRLCLEIWKIKSVVEKTIAPHCSSGLFTA